MVLTIHWKFKTTSCFGIIQGSFILRVYPIHITAKYKTRLIHHPWKIPLKDDKSHLSRIFMILKIPICSKFEKNID